MTGEDDNVPQIPGWYFARERRRRPSRRFLYCVGWNADFTRLEACLAVNIRINPRPLDEFVNWAKAVDPLAHKKPGPPRQIAGGVR